jgi:dipeptidyl aminopeptidase/acylaminoacyl peptidase
VRIIGKLTSVNQLPTASASYIGKCYLITSGNITYMYIVQDNQNGTYQWINGGVFTGGSIVTTNGVVQEQWESNSKLDKFTTVTDNAQLYMKNKGGTNALIDLAPGNAVVNGAVTRYSSSGTVRTKNATNTADAVPLNQMNTAIATAKGEIAESLTTIEGDIVSLSADIESVENNLANKSDKIYRHTITFNNQDVLYFFNASSKQVDDGNFHMTFYHYSTQSTPMSYTEIYNLLTTPSHEGTGVTNFTTMPKYISFNVYDNETGQEAFCQVLSARQADQFIFWAMTAQVNPEIRTYTVSLSEIYNDNYSWYDTVTPL